MEKFSQAQVPLRKEDERLLRGSGRFVDDVERPGQAWLYVVRSPHPHARLGAVEVAAARRAPGVLAVVTGAELAGEGAGPLPFGPGYFGEDGQPATAPDRMLLATDTVRFVGEGVVAIVAETLAQAKDAADLVVIDYVPLPAVVSAVDALSPEAPRQWPGKASNVAGLREVGDPKAVDAAIAVAAHVTRLTLVQSRLAPTSMEPRGALAEFDPRSGRLTIHASTQNPTGFRAQLAANVLQMPEEAVRVLVGDVGGGFGMKVNPYPEEALVAWLARRLQRPVKWCGERAEALLGDCHGRDQVVEATLALAADGRILAYRVDTIANIGAYVASAGIGIPLTFGPKVFSGAYVIPAFHFRGRAVLTHTTPVNAYRGAGRPENIYVIERMLDAAAREMGLDPAAIRRRNFIAPDAFPYVNATGEVYDCGAFASVLTRGIIRSDWEGFAARREASRKAGRLRGRGLAYYIEWTGGDLAENARIIVEAGGRVRVWTGLQNMGQGLETAFAQMVASQLGIGFERIDVVFGDTDMMNGVGSVASRSAFTGAAVLKAGSDTLIDRGRELAAAALEAPAVDIEYRAGRFVIAGTDRSIDLFELAGREPTRVIDVQARTSVKNPAWPNGCIVIEVEVDPETGHVSVERATTVDDLGTVVNPAIVAGQVHGGLAQGIGQALLEQCVYDTSGQLLTGSLMDYTLPRADDLPAIDHEAFPGVPSPGNPYGIKGVGEVGCVGGPPAAVNAVIDALAPLGVRHLDMPVTAERVWRAINARN